MVYPLLGLGSVLSDAECDSVELRSASGGAIAVFSRQGDDYWASEDQGSDPLHTEELLAAVQHGFGREFDTAECVLVREKVVYTIERGAVKVKREARAPRPPGAETEQAGLKALAEALGIPKSKRRPKLEQAIRFAEIVEHALAGRQQRDLRILDLACGRSYLGFVLVHQLTARGYRAELHGLDSEPALTDKCCEIAETLRWTNTRFEVGDLSKWSPTSEAYDVLVSLHGCDTLTDEAIRIAQEIRAPLLFVAPCCQHELRHLWKAHPLQWISRYGLLEQRLADVLTDGFRCLVLEALGYRVKVLRFTAPDITPKNLLVHAELVSGPKRERADTAWAFLKQFGVRPRLTAVLEAAGLHSR